MSMFECLTVPYSYPGGAEESLTGAVPALADVAPVADVARIASTAHAVANRAAGFDLAISY